MPEYVCVVYERGGEVVSDWQAEAFAYDIIEAPRYSQTFSVSTENVIHILLTMIAEGKVPSDAIRFWFEDKPVIVNKYGAVHEWPEGWATLVARFGVRRLKAQVYGRKTERDNHV